MTQMKFTIKDKLKSCDKKRRRF